MISVIIPCLNEEENLHHLLQQLGEQQEIDLEVIVADGGSSDNTASLANEQGARVVLSGRGRGKQQNTGARAATADYLLFLHADSRLEHHTQLSQALNCLKAAGKRSAGHFSIRFETDSQNTHERLRLFEYKTSLNRDGTFNGDQGLLIRRDEFRLLGGFSEKYHFLEDKEFAERYNEFGHFETLPGTLYTSARRFEQEGLEERLVLNVLIMGMFHLDCDQFFNRASDAYRDSSPEGKLDLAPFFELTQAAVFCDGLTRGLVRCFIVGRYATKNLWQVSLSRHIRNGTADKWLNNYDRFLKPLTNNPLGYVLGTLIVLSWFYTKRFKLRNINSRSKKG